MDDLMARLEGLLHLYAAAGAEDHVDDARLTKQFRKSLQL